ncbi:EAL domain-containing protein [Cupriavidus pauculus]|uniref:cyclic-guanylate-specific phosphodiesterase n=1 Tax=Cupriavidus pauculus TaxID=82633 RepID=A0A3G8H1P4_9BURK|nr:EAL domain-containing protein [Cupriavidus pauculus]AZG14378.1 cyclic diguanylate phosphodiesterase [Cupriavidus pauculus]
MASNFWSERFGGWHVSPMTLLVWIFTCLCFVAVAVALGRRQVDRIVTQREVGIGTEIVAALDRMVETAGTQGRQHAAKLAGQPCGQIEQPLGTAQSFIPYIRAVGIAERGVIYCSSTRGAVSVPLDYYFRDLDTGTPQRLMLVQGTPFRTYAPALAMFLQQPGQPGSGTFLLIDGRYVTDTLSHGLAFGASEVVLSVGQASIYHDGTFLAAPVKVAGGGVTSRSTAWPMQVHVAASADYVTTVRRKYDLLYGAIGLLGGLLAVALFLLVAAPRRLLMQAVRQSLRRGDFHVAYQPIVEVGSRRWIGAEALLRWQHPRWGSIPPGSYIETIESTPLIDDITHFVLRRVVEDMNRYGPLAPLHMAVNAAPLNLRRRTFLHDLDALQRAMPDGSGLVLEITERHLLGDSGATREAFDRLHESGIRLAVDDFGTRNSNLDLIRSLPFDYLKIDRQFTQDVDANARALLRSIVSMAHHFHLVVIAEGIETEAQHALIAEAGVDWAQGYLYQRPAPPASILARRGIWVNEQSGAEAAEAPAAV